MCGIVGAAAQRNVTGILLEGLKRLEYRGYDSAGIAVLDVKKDVCLQKNAGKVAALEQGLASNPLQGHLGIAHTRWATHGSPNDANSHPHRSEHIAVVHNGIIENHEALRSELQAAGYTFISETDTEVVAHLVHLYSKESSSLLKAVQQTIVRLEGAYALAVMSADEPAKLIGARKGSPLVLGVGIEENFLASDPLALRQVTDRFVFLGEGDMVELSASHFQITDSDGRPVDREIVQIDHGADHNDKGGFRHYMLKEIYQQPDVLAATLQGRISDRHVLAEAFGSDAVDILKQVECVHIIACGTSYHAGMVARYWLESWAGIPCQVEVASEYRYRKVVVPANTLFLSISQSGETADTLAALQAAEQAGYLGTMVVCNVANSSLVRESDLTVMTMAGPEIGVASTKAFTTQLVALQLLSIVLARFRGGIDEAKEQELVEALQKLPQLCREILTLDKEIERTFQSFADKQNALFLGRGVQYPIA
ncbi:MAG: glutamine--fructose-6-phosphate transaminase (isomerizing), partial [Candidatus Reddybacter sp.]